MRQMSGGGRDYDVSRNATDYREGVPCPPVIAIAIHGVRVVLRERCLFFELAQ